ncbi:MAG: hypothetical protein M3Z66_18210 [Chloroflexota bacterium]|nr:hypothetical protein [Chloroflexota bacterium]
MGDRSPNAGLLFARIQLRYPGARHILLVPADTSGSTTDLARQLAAAIAGAGQRVSLIDVGGGKARPKEGAELSGTLATAGVHTIELLEAEMGDAKRIGRALESQEGFTVASAGPLQHDEQALRLSAAMDAVIVVVRRGRTLRSELAEIRHEIASVGGTLAGAVIID